MSGYLDERLQAVQAAVRATGISSLDYDDLKYAVAATVEQEQLPFVCCVWLYIVASFRPAPL